VKEGRKERAVESRVVKSSSNRVEWKKGGRTCGELLGERGLQAEWKRGERRCWEPLGGRGLQGKIRRIENCRIIVERKRGKTSSIVWVV